jgi:hypothetical protein
VRCLSPAAVPAVPAGTSRSQQLQLRLSVERGGLYWSEVEKRECVIDWGRKHCAW